MVVPFYRGLPPPALRSHQIVDESGGVEDIMAILPGSPEVLQKNPFPFEFFQFYSPLLPEFEENIGSPLVLQKIPVCQLLRWIERNGKCPLSTLPVLHWSRPVDSAASKPGAISNDIQTLSPFGIIFNFEGNGNFPISCFNGILFGAILSFILFFLNFVPLAEPVALVVVEKNAH